MGSKNLTSSDSPTWVDITQEFQSATREMELGELLHDNLFGLFEAMSAIEMMDPKMDAGMLCNRDKKVLNFEQSVKEGKLKLKNLSHEERIGIIDDTFSCLVTWLEGHSLAQTVFTNLYLHNPFAIEDKCIRCFSFLILKIVEIIIDFVNQASVVEEEDIQCACACIVHFELNEVTKACSMIKEAEEELQKEIKSFQKSNLGKSNSADDSEKLLSDKNEKNDHQLNLALFARLKFSRFLFHTLMTLKKEASVKTNRKTVNVSAIEELEKYFFQCSETIQILENTLEYGIKPEASPPSSNEFRADYPTIMGFEPLVNQRSLPLTFPRYTRMKSRKEAIQYMSNLVNRLKHICKIYQHPGYHSALDFFTQFSKSSTKPSCVLSRSILQTLYLPTPGLVFGVTRFVDTLREDVRAFIKPPCLEKRSSILNVSQAKEYVDLFFEHCVRPMTLLLQINGHNRARQRDKLAHVLEELASLQDEAEILDTFLDGLTQKQENSYSHTGYFSTWILYHILRVMTSYLLSGFELELYSTHEYCYIFWYLYEFLFVWMVSTLNLARNLILKQESITDQKNRNTKKVKAKRRKLKFHHKESILNQGLHQLCGGFYKTVYAFKIDGKLKLPWSGLNSEQIRYEHRFMPFKNVMAPPPVLFSQYKERMDQGLLKTRQKPRDLYITACKCFETAKKLFESIIDPDEEILSYIKIAKTNIVVIKLLLSGKMEESKLLPEFDYSVHKNFPIIRIF